MTIHCIGEEAEDELNRAGWTDGSDPEPEPDYDDPMYGEDWDDD